MKKILFLSTALLTATIPAVADGLPFSTAVINLQNVAETHQFEGTVEAVNKATISAQTSGRIIEINFDVDDYVKAGEVIIRFSDKEHKARLDQATSELKSAIARRVAAEQDFNRVSKLFKKGTVARARYDNAKSSIDSAIAQQERAQAAVQQAKEQLAYTVVRAPFSGFVIQRHVEIGEAANPGTPLMTGFSLEKLRVRSEVPQQFARVIREQNRATVIVDKDTTIKAESLTVFPFADPKSNTVTVRLRLPDGTKSVFPGMLVKTVFKTGENSVLTMPEKAIVRRSEVTGAYLVLDHEKVRFQQIRAGRSFANGKVAVLSGLEAGDKVALDPLKALIHIKAGAPK